MTPEDIAKRYAHKPGFRLIDFAEVGLPIYQLTILASTLAHKKISPIEEFILKCTKAGFTSVSDISKFLGLKESIVESSVIDLNLNEDISYSGEQGFRHASLKLTKKGENALRDAEFIVPEESTLQIEFDGLLRQPMLSKSVLYEPKTLREFGLVEIPALPPKPPDLKDLSIKRIEALTMQALRNHGHLAEAKRTILQIKSLEKRKRLFLPSVALIYKAKDSKEIAISFAIDGRLSMVHEQAFVQSGGLNKLKVKLDLEEETSGLTEKTTTIKNNTKSFQEFETLEEEKAIVVAQMERAKEETAQAGSDSEKKIIEEKLEAASKRIVELQAQLDLMSVRQLSVYEHHDILQKALTDSLERLMIISPWIRFQVVNRSFIDKLRILLQRNVRIYIGYGIGEREGDKPQIDKWCKDQLEQLANIYRKNFYFKYIGKTHAKILLYDKKLLITTSFNWLSFKGDRNYDFRDERGTLIKIPENIDEEFEYQLNYFRV